MKPTKFRKSEATPEEITARLKAQKAAHYLRRREHIRARAAAYYIKNKEKIIKHVMQYAAGKKSKLREYHKKYYRENKEKWENVDASKRSEKSRARYRTPEGRARRLNDTYSRRAIIMGCDAPATHREVMEFMGSKRECLYCGKSSTKLTLDHFMPLKQGGEHCLENFAAACKSCNCRKNNKHPEDFLIEIGLLPN